MTRIVPLSTAGDLARVEVETLAQAYMWLAEVRAAHAGFLVERAERVAKLDARAGYVLGSLNVARRFLCESAGTEAAAADRRQTELAREEEAPRDVSLADERHLVPGGQGRSSASPDSLAEMLERTEAELEQAREALDLWAAEQESRLAEALEAAERAVLERVDAYGEHHAPPLRLEVTRLAGDRSIVHLHRPGDDDAVLLCRLLAGRPPSRHDFLRDDSVDAVDGPVNLAAGEQGLDPDAVTKGGPEAEEALARDAGRRLLPIRAHVPVLVPGATWPRMRLRTRGPVLELEARGQGEAYTHICRSEQAELFTGYLLALHAGGRLEVDIRVP